VGHADVILHPVRLRIVQAFLGREQLTTSDLRALLPDVPTATLYRQVNALLAADVIEVTEERKVRGAVERTMRVPEARMHVDADEAAAMTAEEHRRAFLTFVAGLLADFDRYLERDDPDLARDVVGYSQVALVATDTETTDYLGAVRELAAPQRGRPERDGRRRRLFTTVLMPDR
jgi:hypothetical protein